MAPAIGAIAPHAIRGTLAPMGLTLREETRPHVDGVAYTVTGKRSMVSRIQTFEFLNSSTTSAATRKAAYKALQGTLVSVTDGFDETTANVAVLNVSCRVQTIKDADGPSVPAGSDTLITATWTLQDTNVPS